MNREKLNQILAEHKLWLLNKGGKMANLKGADLGGVDLRWANLKMANLKGANLRRADLQEADLRGANLKGANLRRANIQEANLGGADLRGANLRGALSNKYSFLSVYGIGSHNRQTLYIPEMDKVYCGCFIGTMEEFIEKIESTYLTNSKHYLAYMNAVEYLKKQAEIYRKD